MAEAHLECEPEVSEIVRESISSILAAVFVLIHFISHDKWIRLDHLQIHYILVNRRVF